MQMTDLEYRRWLSEGDRYRAFVFIEELVRSDVVAASGAEPLLLPREPTPLETWMLTQAVVGAGIPLIDRETLTLRRHRVRARGYHGGRLPSVRTR